MKKLNIIKVSAMFVAFSLSLPAFSEEEENLGKTIKPDKLMTEMDFDSTMVDGKMKAPAGFFLQGRNKQSLQSMVKLRSNFRDKLRNSKSAVKALVK